MSENININVLVAAKEEYTKQLVYILSPEIYNILLNVYHDSQQLKKKRSISLRNFQICLKKIPEWNTLIIEKNNETIKTKFPYLLDLITAIFVSHVKILACVKLNNGTKSIDVKVPNLDHFLHKIIVTNAEKIYYNPDIILKKKEFVIEIISNNIEQTIRNQIPIDKILTEYLSGVFEDEKINNSNINFGNSIKQNIDEDSDEEIEEEEDKNDNEEEFSDQESDEEINDNEELLDNKNIIPTRPLPINQLDNIADSTSSIPTPYNQTNNNLNQQTINNNQQNINKKVLFSDATSKEKKYETDDDDVDDEESEVDVNSDSE